MRPDETNGDSIAAADAETLALAALAWILADGQRADRLLALTGLEAGDLRERIGEPSLHDAVLGFLESHEPDLVRCAEAIGVRPMALINARAKLA